MRTLLFACLALLTSVPAVARDYAFRDTISREVLENYLSRSITMMDLLTGQGNFDDNLRMLAETGAKFAGRTVYVWGSERHLPERLATARRLARRVHAADAEMILQGAVFEIVTREVETLAVPEWVFAAFDLSAESRNFRYEAMLYPDGGGRNHWSRGASIPDVSQLEAQLWFFFLAASYIDAGCEAIHFGQLELVGRNDPDFRHWDTILSRVRRYAAANARRGMVLCDAHVPGGGPRRGERLLLDFHSFPLRIQEVPERPHEGVLEVGAHDSFYGRSRGGVAPSGWRSEHLPYLVEIDNWDASDRPGEPGVGWPWIWGYDEMSWFAHQDAAYRNAWLRYAWDWIREHDPNGFLQMPGSRCLHTPVDGRWWYWANTPSEAQPNGFGQEETIRAIWQEDN